MGAHLALSPWGLPSYDAFVGSRIAEGFRAKGLDLPRQTVTSNSIQRLNALLSTGQFLAALSESTLRLSGKRLGLKAVAVDLPIQAGPVGIVTLKSRTLSPVGQLFIDHARQVAKPLARRG